VGDGGEEDDLGGSFAGVVGLLLLLEEGVEVGFEAIETVGALEGFVEAEEGEDDGGFGFFEPLLRRAEVFGARADGEFVGGEAEIADREIEVGEGLMEHGLEGALVLETVGEGVADDGDVVVLGELEGGLLGEGVEGREERDGEGESEIHGGGEITRGRDFFVHGKSGGAERSSLRLRGKRCGVWAKG
jgi:hypothetical protein